MAQKPRSPLIRFFGLLLVVGGLFYFYYWPVKNGGFAEYSAHFPKPWKIFSALIGAFVIYLCFINRQEVLRRVVKSLAIMLITLMFGVIAYFAMILIVGVIRGRSLNQLYLSLAASSGPHFELGNILGQLLAVFFVIAAIRGGIATLFEKSASRRSISHQRGRRLITYSEAQTIASSLKAEGERGVFWGMLFLPLELATTHFLVTGATGSGKTITLRLLMQSVFPWIGKGSDSRALVYDAKQDILSIVGGMGLSCDVVTLNPFDKRCAAWSIAKDITGPATAQHTSTILIPENRQESQPFFSDAARHLLTGVLVTFIKTAPEKWTLRDVVLAMRSKERLRQVLSILPDTRDLLEYFANDITAQNILSTLQSRMQRYEFIAAAWEKAGRSISLKEWLEGESILVLGNDEATRTALDAINQVIFKRLTELILAEPESTTRRTWIFLDEVREAGELDGLGRLLTKGRSKGACVVLGFQDIDGMRDVYGTELANEIAGLCSNKAILRTDSASTAEWASKLFGDREVLEIRQSSGESAGEHKPASGVGSGSSKGTSKNEQEQLNKREVVLPSEIMDLLPTNPRNGLSGYYLTPAVGAYFARISGDSIARELWPADESIPNVEPRPESDQYLSNWTDDDLRRLGIPSGKGLASYVQTEIPRNKDGQIVHEVPDLGFLSQIKRE